MKDATETGVLEAEIRDNCGPYSPHCEPSFEGESAAALISSRELFNEVYAELKTMAHRELSRSKANTLGTTALVHELYLKLCATRDPSFPEPVKFFRYAAMAMRHILLDRAYHRLRFKFGGRDAHVGLDDPGVDDLAGNPQLALQLDAALNALSENDARAARVVELHFFAGLPLEQIAGLLELNRRTIERDWRYARAFLSGHVDLSDQETNAS